MRYSRYVAMMSLMCLSTISTSFGVAEIVLRGEGYQGSFEKLIFARCRMTGADFTGIGYVPVKFTVRDDESEATAEPEHADKVDELEEVVELDFDDAPSVARLAKNADERAWIFGGRDCPECNYVKRLVLPKLFADGSRGGRIVSVDLNVRPNIQLLLNLESHLRVNTTGKSPVLYWKGSLYYGTDSIKHIVEEDVNARAYVEVNENDNECVPGAMKTALLASLGRSDSGEIMARERISKLTLVAVLLGGLTDGINPCVFTGLIFFISLLSVSGIKGRRMLIAGISYCAACFIVYVMLGFGVLGTLRWIGDFSFGRIVLNYAMTAVLVVLSILSFADAWRFKKSGKASDVRLQLPNSVKKLTRLITRRGLKYKYLVPGAFLAGALVTSLEALCTGQVYVPVLAMVAGSGGDDAVKSAMWLLLYNAMFMVPLVIVFILALKGASGGALTKWSRSNVVYGKVAMGLFLHF